MAERKLDEVEFTCFMCVDAGSFSDAQLAKCAKAMEEVMEKYLGQSRTIRINTYRENE